MLRNLHVKNLALIREVDVDFSDGLTVLTGETGAGKSILIGSLVLVLGGRLPKDMTTGDGSPALIEAVFEPGPGALTRLEAAGVPVEDDLLIISRRIDGTRSVFRLNGETVTAARVRTCADILIDIHGQHENQTLLRPEKQLALLDDFGGEATAAAREACAAAARRYQALKAAGNAHGLSDEERARRMDFLRFEIGEIEEAALKAGEDEELEERYKKLANIRRLMEAVSAVHTLTGYETSDSAGEQIGAALRELEGAVRYDAVLQGPVDVLRDIDALLNDFNREIARYLADAEDDPHLLEETGKRLDTINRLKMKYGRTLEDVLAALDERRAELEALENYEEEKRQLEAGIAEAYRELREAAAVLTARRREAAAVFEKEAAGHFLDLNFDRADFRIDFREAGHIGENGADEIEFMIATNPGRPVMPLREVASGGELSRIMLGIRTMFAARDDTDTLIFDEIDTGISGRTAQKVAEKLNTVGSRHQTLCITHLPQIAAMADHHLAITKAVTADSAETQLQVLDDGESVRELARLIGGARITDSTLAAAEEMKALSQKIRFGTGQSAAERVK